MKTRADGILFLLQPISSVVIKQITFSQDKSPFPDPDSSLPKAILKTSGVGLCTYFFFLEHLQLSSSTKLDKDFVHWKHHKSMPEHELQVSGPEQYACPAHKASVGTCPVERDVLHNIAFEGSAK